MDSLARLTENLSQCQHHYNEALRLMRETSKEYESTKQEFEAVSQRLKEYDNTQTRNKEQIETLSKENCALKAAVDDLKQELRDRDSAHLHEDDSAFEKNLLDKAKKHDPEVIIYHFESSPGIVDYDLYSRVAGFYGELYAENINLIKSFCKLRRNHKASKEKLVLWNRLLEKDSFETTVNGEAVIFKRVSPEHVGEMLIAESPVLPPLRSYIAQDTDYQNKTPTRSQVREHHSDLASTQSQDLRYDERRLPQTIESPDTPVVVKERPVRKQQVPSPTYCAVKVEESPTDIGTAEKPFNIKSEPTPSPPGLVSDIRHHEDHGKHNHDPVSSPTLDPIESPLPRPKFTVLPDRRSPSPELQDDPLDLPANKQTELPSKKRGRQVLRPVDTNVTPTCKLNEASIPQSKRRKPHFSRGAHAIPSVAEDGEAEEYLTGRRSSRPSMTDSAKKSTPSTKMRQTRLQDLLETSHTPRPVLLSTPQSVIAKPDKFVAPQTPNNKAEGAATPYASQQPESHDIIPFPEEVDDDEIRPRSCFRDRPISELGLEHFKLNPNKNQGLDYAFDEVVRDKSMRKQLRGCLRQECCGPVYRSMAKDEIGEEPRPLGTLSRADHDLLKGDLGSNYGKFLEGKSPIEIRDVLIEAKASVLSNKFSKHRNAHVPGGSPPGYWRTDMPNTQEIERDRMMARKLEREKVLDRYKEACKDDGYWKFADE
ncbi:TPA_exp: Uncharacterized protein A8136_0260 [Trichophyton benhamiae CBS 112371]|uniref:DNA endonuclease activator Ctp1 C-terminal domain-containing protein n=1 Tax=Arthroderma benhamiae (strain ATCC MYA-4681 / CBS 112371) TaxID=663331 RepID=D4AIZ5_ARTBC|nr:uncharacterized protein ARB_04243 [Trichophyton benhamiae CBS 112371]EFE36718.1 conserved hypothetical protein [Trichophyton benhamiae CBS 112371]DAA79487.1 TPA_exp: Uncharacterized protein A8136_0260 [Trichophyton benhamiae CBS 112371]